MQIENLGIFKNLFYGASIGFFVSFALNLFLISAVNDYYYLDDWVKLFYGGGGTGIVLAMLAQWFKNKDEFYSLNLWVGIILIFVSGFAGAFIPIFVLGPIVVLFSVLGVPELSNYLIGDLLGGFCAGGISVGLAAGLFNHLQKKSN